MTSGLILESFFSQNLQFEKKVWSENKSIQNLNNLFTPVFLIFNSLTGFSLQSSP